MSRLVEEFLRESKALRESEGVCVYAMKDPLDLSEVLLSAEHSSFKEISVTEIRVHQDLDRFVDDLKCTHNTDCVIEPTKGWVKFEDSEGELPPIYVNSEGSNYGKYVGVALENEDEWREIWDMN